MASSSTASNELLKREIRSQVIKFDSPEMSKFEEYEYDPLPDTKKTIRAIRLRTGPLASHMIECEMFTIEFSDRYEPQFEDRPIEYEALSWSWGNDVPQYGIVVIEGQERYKLRVKRELALALKYLRKTNKERILWIDAVCIDQNNFNERNHQVQMMAMIYTRAKKVCIWLGEDDDNTNMAIHFIIHQIMHLDRFDSICKDEKNTDNWQALLALMQRRWFRRRWVVQEVALSRRAKVYCGVAKISWTDFAVAVELFVEVETATHRLSEVIQKDARFYHVPNWFEYVSELGASRLVQATASIFRIPESRLLNPHHNKPKGLSNGTAATTAPGSEEPDGPVDPLDRRGLLSLEHLVSTLSTFEASEPRDVIYSLLAIARDTTPMADVNNYRSTKSRDSLVMMSLSSFLERKPYRVDYNLPYSDVCKDFVQFCIERAMVSDPSKALDILCRPWAPPPFKGDHGAAKPKKKKKKSRKGQVVRQGDPNETGSKRKGIWVDGRQIPLWIATERHRRRRMGFKKLPYAEAREGGDKNWVDDPRDTPTWKAQWKDKGFVSQKVLKYFPAAETEEHGVPNGPDRGEDASTSTQKKGDGSGPAQVETSTTATDPHRDIDLPTWVAAINGAPFAVFEHPGLHVNRERMGRKNADPLVGHPQDGVRSYTAAQTQKPRGRLDFRRRPVLGHYSFFVRGFVLDTIVEVSAPAYGGNIPKAWTEVAGWDDWTQDPPDDFLRTLVADRGKNNRNPPHYYAKACRESVVKGSGQSGRVDVGGLINNEQNSIITEFCRRVQEVIWNRRLVKTKRGTLGLSSERVEVGDLVCIIYGCSVPLILREFKKDVVELQSGGERAGAGSDSSSPNPERDARSSEVHVPDDEATSVERARLLLEQLEPLLKREPSQNGENGAGPSISPRDEALMAIQKFSASIANPKPEDARQAALDLALSEVLKKELAEDNWERLKAWIRHCEMKLVKKARYRQLVEEGFHYKKIHFTGSEYQDYIGYMTKVANDHLRSLRDAEQKKKAVELGARIVLHRTACDLENRKAEGLLKESKAALDVAGQEYADAEQESPRLSAQPPKEQPAIPQQMATHEKDMAEAKRKQAKDKRAKAKRTYDEAVASQKECVLRLGKAQDAIGEKEKLLEKVTAKPDKANRQILDELENIYKGLSPKQDEEAASRRYFYRVMGESYIHGMMDGDAIGERLQRDIQEQSFELR